MSTLSQTLMRGVLLFTLLAMTLAAAAGAVPTTAQQWDAPAPSPFGVVEAYYRPGDARDLRAG